MPTRHLPWTQNAETETRGGRRREGGGEDGREGGGVFAETDTRDDHTRQRREEIEGGRQGRGGGGVDAETDTRDGHTLLPAQRRYSSKMDVRFQRCSLRRQPTTMPTCAPPVRAAQFARTSAEWLLDAAPGATLEHAVFAQGLRSELDMRMCTCAQPGARGALGCTGCMCMRAHTRRACGSVKACRRERNGERQGREGGEPAPEACATRKARRR